MRDAASVLLTRGEGDGLEVFLVERSPELRFFGGYWAFPGGVVDARDMCDGADAELALRRCAVRELFEETGVLAGELAPRLATDARAALRDRLLESGAEPGASAAWDSAIDGLPLQELTVCLRITTPDFVPVRYRTVFYQLELPAGEAPGALSGELAQGAWLRPAAALERWRRGELLLVPPVLFQLELIAEHGLAGALLAGARAAEELERGRLHPIRHSPGIFAAPLCTPTVPPATTTNTYLVGEERIWVVDPATYEERERARLFAAMDEWLAAGRRFEGILLTHHHADHVGAVNETSRRYGLDVRAHALTLDRIPPGFRRGAPLADGDELELGRAPDGSPDWKLRALHTPGHDRGHLCFLESRYGALLAGDMLSTLSTIVIDPPEGHLVTYLASLERLLAEPVSFVHPAHGMAWRDGHELVRQYLAHRAEREQELVAALERAGPRAPAQLVPEVYADTPEELWPLAERSLLAGLLKLEQEGRARRTGAGWAAPV